MGARSDPDEHDPPALAIPAASARAALRPTALPLRLDEPRHVRPRCGDDRRLGCLLRIDAGRRGLRRVLRGAASHANEVFRQFKFLILRPDAFELESEQPAGARGELGADLSADARRDEVAERAAGERDRFLDRAFDEATGAAAAGAT